jgi:phytoene dehydrogenase-like protein
MTARIADRRVVVVGAGINGLVAAHYLRRAGGTVTVLERAPRAGGACVFETATINGRTQRYALGASVLGLMPDFIFRETGLAARLQTYVPSGAKRIYFPDPGASAWIHRDPAALDRELHQRWGEKGDVSGFRRDERRVVAYLQEG